jgi:hypothetical protein
MIETIISVSGPIFVVSLFIMMVQFKRWNKYTWGQLRHDPLWPLKITEYRDYTKEKYGRTGTLYYVSVLSGLVTASLLLLQGLIWLL